MDPSSWLFVAFHRGVEGNWIRSRDVVTVTACENLTKGGDLVGGWDCVEKVKERVREVKKKRGGWDNL